MKWIEPLLSSKQRGDQFERLAVKYFQKQGLKIIENNYHSRFGEIDIIMNDNDVLVFIEVKYRKSIQFGSPLAVISLKKQQKIIKTAKIYMQKHGMTEYNTPCRFDVISLLGSPHNPKITWLKNAFYGV